MKHLSTGKDVFEKLSNDLMFALTVTQYEQTLDRFEAFIEEKKEQREFLYQWLAWWDRRRAHFSKAYKNPSAPNTNISEAYNSKYVTGKEINLKLVDSAKFDIAEAMKVSRTFKRFGEGLEINGSGPSAHERLSRDHRQQKRRASSYARDINIDSSDSDSEAPTRNRKWQKTAENKRDSQGKSKRPERRRSTRSKTFTKSLTKATENHHHVTLLSVNQFTQNEQEFNVKYFDKNLKVIIREKPSCTCSFYVENNARGSQTCLHIIWIMLNYYRLSENDSMLQQVSLTVDELNSIFGLQPNIDFVKSHSDNIPSTSNYLTPEEQMAIFEGKEKVQRWKINKSNVKKNAKCSTCKSTMPAGKMFVEVDGLYIPKNQTFAVDRKFYFCALFSCLKKVNASNIVPPTSNSIFMIADESGISIEEMEILKTRGFIGAENVLKFLLVDPESTIYPDFKTGSTSF